MGTYEQRFLNKVSQEKVTTFHVNLKKPSEESFKGEEWTEIQNGEHQGGSAQRCRVLLLFPRALWTSPSLSPCPSPRKVEASNRAPGEMASYEKAPISGQRKVKRHIGSSGLAHDREEKKSLLRICNHRSDFSKGSLVFEFLPVAGANPPKHRN